MLERLALTQHRSSVPGIGKSGKFLEDQIGLFLAVVLQVNAEEGTLEKPALG